MHFLFSIYGVGPSKCNVFQFNDFIRRLSMGVSGFLVLVLSLRFFFFPFFCVFAYFFFFQSANFYVIILYFTALY